MILSTFRCARARRGAIALPARPADSAAAPVACMKRSRESVLRAMRTLLACGPPVAPAGLLPECGRSPKGLLVNALASRKAGVAGPSHKGEGPVPVGGGRALDRKSTR